MPSEFVNALNDVKKMHEALYLIQKECTSNDCYDCMFGDSTGGCLLTDEIPRHWEIPNEPLTKLLK